MPVVLSVVGRSNSGKTTLLESLIPELKRRSYRVAVVKHSMRGFDLDQPGKDSWRLTEAGSDAIVLSAPQKVALIKKVGREATLEELLTVIGDDYDLILVEGFKHSNAPKIEVHLSLIHI